jgi:hypothetical protein
MGHVAPGLLGPTREPRPVTHWQADAPCRCPEARAAGHRGAGRVARAPRDSRPSRGAVAGPLVRIGGESVLAEAVPGADGTAADSVSPPRPAPGVRPLRGLLRIRVIWCHRAIRPQKYAFSASRLAWALVPCDVMRYRTRFLDITAGESHDPLARYILFCRGRT